MMLDGAWVKGESGPRLAIIWGVADATVEGYAAEASRTIQRNVDPDAVREQLGAGLNKVFRVAVKRGDARGAADVAKVYAPIAGVTDGDGAKVQLTFIQNTSTQIGQTIEDWLQQDWAARLRARLADRLQISGEPLDLVVAEAVATLTEGRALLDARILALRAGS